MKFPIGKFLTVAGRVGVAVLTGVPAVQAFAQTLGGAKGEQKATAVLELALAELQAASVATGRDLSVHPGVVAAIRGLIDAAVAMHKAIADAAADPATP
jgi:hypothetical protein